jgi:DNA (cytosine-5)-methyltransferase 1
MQAQIVENTLRFNKPAQATKQLALQKTSDGRRKLVVSTNWLPLFGFEKDTRVVERLIGNGGEGIVISPAEDLFNIAETKKVYSRTYKSRRNNPIETMLDIRGQKLLDAAFPEGTECVHILFRDKEIRITPVRNKVAERIAQAVKSHQHGEILSAFSACTAGVDALGLVEEGFQLQSILEYRPHEARDKQDLTETGALNVVANLAVKSIFNEDIGCVDLGVLARSAAASPSTLLQLSIQCDEFSNVKAKSLKESALDDLSSSADMVYDALRLIETLNSPCVLLEQVPGFMTSQAGAIFETKLRKWGYSVHKTVMDSRDYGGLTSRKRFYLFASSLPAEFSWPAAIARRITPIWDEYIAPVLDQLRDVTHTKSMQDGLACGRLRVIDRESTCSPTLLKSQNRQAKDSVVIRDGDRLLFPTVELMQKLMQIPDRFSTEAVSTTIASEIIGQSVDYGMHRMIIGKVVEHIHAFAKGLMENMMLPVAA